MDGLDLCAAALRPPPLPPWGHSYQVMAVPCTGCMNTGTLSALMKRPRGLPHMWGTHDMHNGREPEVGLWLDRSPSGSPLLADTRGASSTQGCWRRGPSRRASPWGRLCTQRKFFVWPKIPGPDFKPHSTLGIHQPPPPWSVPLFLGWVYCCYWVTAPPPQGGGITRRLGTTWGMPATHALHKAFPMTVNCRGCPAPPMQETQHRAGGCGVTRCYPSVVRCIVGHFGF